MSERIANPPVYTGGRSSQIVYSLSSVEEENRSGGAAWPSSPRPIASWGLCKKSKDLLAQIEALKTADTSAEFHAGVNAAKEIVNTIVQEALDRERIQKLEVELAELRTKYSIDGQAAPKRRGRRPKAAQVQEELGQGME